MNDTLLSTILSSKGRKLLSHFPKSKNSALNIGKIAKKADISTVTAYRIIQILKEWDNIVWLKNPVDTGGSPEILYYIKSRKFIISIKNNGTKVRVIR